MSKNTKADVLKHWFGIDHVLFGGPAKKFLVAENLDQYLTTKGALLSNLFEIYKKVGFEGTGNFKTVAEMAAAGVTTAKKSNSRAKRLLENASVKNLLKAEIKEFGAGAQLTESQVAKFVVRKRFAATAIDSMILESVLTKVRREGLTDWQGKVLVNAHKTMRDALIDISLQ
jgi:hypothetical protein